LLQEQGVWKVVTMGAAEYIVCAMMVSLASYSAEREAKKKAREDQKKAQVRRPLETAW
jgi:hypothetical protein